MFCFVHHIFLYSTILVYKCIEFISNYELWRSKELLRRYRGDNDGVGWLARSFRREI